MAKPEMPGTCNFSSQVQVCSETSAYTCKCREKEKQLIADDKGQANQTQAIWRTVQTLSSWQYILMDSYINLARLAPPSASFI